MVNEGDLEIEVNRIKFDAQKLTPEQREVMGRVFEIGYVIGRMIERQGKRAYGITPREQIMYEDLLRILR